MPLNTQIVRDGKQLSLRWGGFHFAAMVLAATYDSGEGPFKKNEPPTEYENGETLNYPEDPVPITPNDVWTLMDYGIVAMTPLNHGEYTLTGEHKFVDVTDDEVLHLLPGDVLRAWRN